MEMTQILQPINQGVAYTVEQVRGLTANRIHEDGFLGFVDKVWLITTRVKTIIIVGTLVLTVLSMLLIAISGKKESFEAGASNVGREVRRSVGRKLKETFYL